MIDSVRNTVLSVLNKNNFGYITPSDFNLYSKQAQLDLFENVFFQYNNQVYKQNLRTTGSDYADLMKRHEEVIDIFSSTSGLNHDLNNVYYLPSESTTGSDFYFITSVEIYRDLRVSGVTTSSDITETVVTDTNSDFISLGVSVGDIVAVELGNVRYTEVLSVVDANNLLVSSNVFDAAGKQYSIYQSNTRLNTAERVSNSRIRALNNSLLTSPSMMFPAYTTASGKMNLYPSEISDVGRVNVQYIRYPKTPKWTYRSLLGGEPVFDQTQTDYQDFELPLEYEPQIVSKILQYTGMSIREAEAFKFGLNTEQKDFIDKK